jgi:hypothetical protein
VALTSERILATLKLIPDSPDVIPTAQLVSLGLPARDMEILAANHTGQEIPGGSATGETSTDRYRGTLFAVDPLLAEEEGVYTPDLLVWLAGKTHSSQLYVGASAKEAIATSKATILATIGVG